jgi:pSer/pThr/pTyr-binding forkhead associated (FHA) protein
MGVSRKHARIIARNSRVTITDLGSYNGTYLNGGKLEPDKVYRLNHGDHLRLGKLELQLSFVVMPSSHEKKQTDYTDVIIPEIGSGQRVLLVDSDEQVTKPSAMRWWRRLLM